MPRRLALASLLNDEEWGETPTSNTKVLASHTEQKHKLCARVGTFIQARTMQDRIYSGSSW
jgi:hypothetical protein